MRQELREYQKDGLSRVLAAYKAGARRVLTVSPTGSGKTTLFCHLSAEVSSRVVILVHRRELATQAANRLREFGVDFGFIMSGEHAKPAARVQVASVQTLVRRTAPPAGLVIVDEAHLSTAATWQQILDSYPHARILGVTATPWRLGGKPLAGAYDDVVVVASPRELREQGHLCDFVGFSYKAPDLAGVEKVGDDYNQGQAGAAMSAIVPNVVEQWKAHASHLSTVVFAVTVEHSQKLTAEFKAAGVRAEHLDGLTSIEQRKAILARVERGQTQVLCNVGVAVEGLDIPRLKCCVLARPTMSLARAIQMMGRVRRPWNGVTARIHDHAFVIGQHGLPDQDRDYSLHAKSEDPPSLTTCSECMALYAGPSCPACSHVNESVKSEREINEITDAEQFDFGSADEPAPATPAEPRPPVVLEWSKVGRMIEGIFKGSVDEKTPFGVRPRFLVEGEKRTYSLPGNTQLAQKMRPVRVGDGVRVTYTGEQTIGAKTMKTFRVERDDGTEVGNRWPELEAYYGQHRRCVAQRDGSLWYFERNSLRNAATRQRVLDLRSKYGIVPKGQARGEKRGCDCDFCLLMNRRNGFTGWKDLADQVENEFCRLHPSVDGGRNAKDPDPDVVGKMRALEYAEGRSVRSTP